MLVNDSFFQRNDGVIRDVDASRTDVSTTFSDVTIADSEDIFDIIYSVFLIHRMHLEVSDANKCPWATEIFEFLVFT